MTEFQILSNEKDLCPFFLNVLHQVLGKVKHQKKGREKKEINRNNNNYTSDSFSDKLNEEESKCLHCIEVKLRLL